MSAIIIVISTALMVYWISRLRILRRGSEDEVRTILEGDLLRGRKVLLGLWPLFIAPIQLVH